MMMGTSRQAPAGGIPRQSLRCAPGSPLGVCGRASPARVIATAWLVREGRGPDRNSRVSKSIRYSLDYLRYISLICRSFVRASVLLVDDEDLLTAATTLRQGTARLARRLRIERPESAQTSLEMGILAHLNRRGPTTPGALATAERVQPQSLTRTLASLERQFLAVRQPDDRDRRRSLLAITEAGRQALAQDMARRDAWLARAMALGLTRAEQELLRIAGELMDRLADTDTGLLLSVGQLELRGGFGRSRRRRGRYPQDARGGGGETPVPAAEQGDGGRHEEGADDGGVQQDANAQAGGHDLDQGDGGGAHRHEGQEQDQRGAGDQAAGAADPAHDRGVGRPGGVVFFPHPAEDEHLVVHGQAEQEREHDHRQPGRDGADRRDAPEGV